MKGRLYSSLQRKMTLVTLLASFVPLAVLGLTIYHQFAQTLRLKIEEQIRYRSRSQAESVDLFLKERSAILSAMADTHRFEDMVHKEQLSRILEVMNARAGAFVDLGVIDGDGLHRSYVGPYPLEGLQYGGESWFAETMARGLHISDVYMGYRRSPHFIIAVRRQEERQTWILRATVDPEIFGAIVRAAHIGKTGDAYIVNREGTLQTRPRFGGEILSDSPVDSRMFGSRPTVVEKPGGNGKRILYAGTWLHNDKWLLVIAQDPEEEMSRLFATRNMEIVIIAAGVFVILLSTVATVRSTVRHLQQSEKKMDELNAQLVQSDKLAALGKMAASVAHEINNPLAVILQKTGWMEDLLEEDAFARNEHVAELRTSLRKIEDHVERARKVVHGMLGYARRMEPRKEDVDVNHTLEETVDLLDNYARINNIAIETELESRLPIIAGDQAQLQQVFLNLISNAIDAIGENGTIRIKSGCTNGMLHVSVCDDGPGLDAEQQRKVFEPFYTTKRPGKGTGLGLWISYNIVEKMGGRIHVYSRKGEGTTFTVEVPAVLPEKK